MRRLSFDGRDPRLQPRLSSRGWCVLLLLLLVLLMCAFNGSLLSSCEQQLSEVREEKEQAVRRAMDKLQEALTQQAEALEELRVQRSKTRALRRQLKEGTEARLSELSTTAAQLATAAAPAAGTALGTATTPPGSCTKADRRPYIPSLLLAGRRIRQAATLHTLPCTHRTRTYQSHQSHTRSRVTRHTCHELE